MKRTIFLALALLLLLTSPVMASYSLTINIVNSASALTNQPVIASINNSSLISNGFLSSTGLDSRVLYGAAAVPHMVTDDKVIFVTDLSANSTKALTYSTGYSPALSSFYIIPGNGGYIFTTDNSTLEPATAFQIDISGYIKTETVGDILLKTGSLHIWVSSASTISAQITHSGGTITCVASGISSGEHNIRFLADGTGSASGVKLYIDDMVTPKNTQADIMPGTPTTQNILPNAAGDYTNITYVFGAATHWQAVDDPVGAPDDITTCIQENSATTIKDAYNLQNGSWGGGGYGTYSVNSIKVYGRYRTDTASSSAYYQPFLRLAGVETTGTEVSNDTGNWTNTNETLARPGGGSWSTDNVDTLQVAIGLRSGPTYGSQCTQVYVEVNYTPYVVASVTNTANNWVWGSSITSYLTSIKYTVSGTEYLWYQPVVYISGTALPNRDSGGSYPGVFTFGSNPGTVTVTLSSIAPSPTAITGAGASSTSLIGAADMPSEMAGMYPLTINTSYIPGADIINIPLQAANIPIVLFWMPVVYGSTIGVFFWVYGKTAGGNKRRNSNVAGQLLPSSMAAEVMLLLWWMGGKGPNPGWTLWILPVFLLVALVRANQYNWRG